MTTEEYKGRTLTISDRDAGDDMTPNPKARYLIRYHMGDGRDRGVAGDDLEPLRKIVMESIDRLEAAR